MPTTTENIHYRYERKFVFENRHPSYVEVLVRNNPANFHEIFQQRKVNNIYFDKPGLKFYSDNYDGNTNRQKVRVRWYGDLIGKVSHPVLEFKIKRGELGLKKSYPLASFTIENGFNAQLLRAVFEQSDLPDHVREEIKGLEARLLNTYCRKYFRSFDHHFRFTIDKDLEYYRFSQAQNLFLHKTSDFQNIILELKYDKAYNYSVSGITSKLPVRLSKFSKYVSGMEKLYPQVV